MQCLQTEGMMGCVCVWGGGAIALKSNFTCSPWKSPPKNRNDHRAKRTRQSSPISLLSAAEALEFREAVNAVNMAVETGGRRSGTPPGIRGKKWSFNPCSADDPG